MFTTYLQYLTTRNPCSPRSKPRRSSLAHCMSSANSTHGPPPPSPSSSTTRIGSYFINCHGDHFQTLAQKMHPFLLTNHRSLLALSLHAPHPPRLLQNDLQRPPISQPLVPLVQSTLKDDLVALPERRCEPSPRFGHDRRFLGCWKVHPRVSRGRFRLEERPGVLVELYPYHQYPTLREYPRNSQIQLHRVPIPQVHLPSHPSSTQRRPSYPALPTLLPTSPVHSHSSSPVPLPPSPRSSIPCA
jgi:hypothetical protein